MANLSVETRRRILSVARTMFDKREFDKVRMEDIAKEAGIGKVTIYRYYPSKDELYHGLLREMGNEYLGVLRAVEASVGGCRARLVAFVRAAMEYFDAYPHLINLLDRAGMDTDRRTDFPWLDVQREFFRMLRGQFAEGVVRGEFYVDDLELAIRALLGGMRFQHLYPSVEYSRSEFPERIVAFLVRPANSSFSARAA